MSKDSLLLVFATFLVCIAGPAGVAQGYTTYNNFGISFELPVVWSVSEEEGDFSKGAIVLDAPTVITTPLEIAWDEGLAGADPRSTLSSMIERFEGEGIFSNFRVVEKPTMIVDGNTAYVRDLSFDESYFTHTATWVAFTSAKSDRFVIIKYQTIFSFSEDNINNFRHLLNSWHDLGEVSEEGVMETALNETTEASTMEEAQYPADELSTIWDELGISSDLVSAILTPLTPLAPLENGSVAYVSDNFGISFEHPPTWSVKEEKGDFTKGSLSMNAPDRMSPLSMSWNEGAGGTDTEFFLNQAVDQLQPGFTIEAVESTTRVVDGNAAQAKSLSIDLGGQGYTNKMVAFTSSRSGRFVYVNYLAPSSSAENIADFEKLLDSWHDSGKTTEIANGNESLVPLLMVMHDPIGAEMYR